MRGLGRSRPAAVAPLLILLLYVQSCLKQASGQKKGFYEEIVASPLFDGRVLVHFHFTSAAPHQRHYTEFPQAVAQLASAVPFDEVELSLTQGRWRYHRWDQPLLPVKPAGAELRAVFSHKVPKPSLPRLWSTLSHALGGLFCASLHFVARAETTAVQAITTAAYAANRSSTGGTVDTSSITWRPEAAKSQVLYAALPQEASCTENLTPWLKLLPCRDAAGVALLLKRRDVIFGAEYHSLKVLVKVERDSKLEPLHITLTQTLSLVLDPNSNSSSSSSRTSSSTRSTEQRTFSDVELDRLMGTELQSACPVAQCSRVYMLLPGQVSTKHQKQLLQLPACTAASDVATSSRSSDIATEPNHPGMRAGTDAGQKSLQRTLTASCRFELDDPPVGAFSLSPAPDAVALLQQSRHSRNTSRVSSQSGSSSDGNIASSPHIMYIYNLQGQRAASTAGRSSSSILALKLSWNSSDGSKQVRGPSEPTAFEQATPPFNRVRPPYTMHRYIVGSGYLHGGIVLELHASAQLAVEGDTGVCIFQMVPWYVRLWLHTLQLTIDGQVSSLSEHLLLRHVSTAQDRARPLVLNLCLRLPASARSISLSAEFTKAFLTAFEHPPDAHRGFDVPAAQVTYLGVLKQQHDKGLEPNTQSLEDGVAGWNVHGFRVRDVGSDAETTDDMTTTPLMQMLAQISPQQVYSPGLVVPLAVPDFSMPYNVICLTSTVLAVFFGAVLNMLLSRPGEEQRVSAAGAEASRVARRKKKLKLLAVVVIFGGLAVYVDPSVQEAVIDQLKAFGLMEPSPPS